MVSRINTIRLPLELLAASFLQYKTLIAPETFHATAAYMQLVKKTLSISLSMFQLVSKTFSLTSEPVASHNMQPTSTAWKFP